MKIKNASIFITHLSNYLRCDNGSQLIEYGLMGIHIAITCIVLLTEIGARPGSIFEAVREALPF